MILQKGFSLIELLVVLAIIGTIAAFAYPSYTDYLRRSKVTEATSNLSNVRVKMEQYFQDNRTYLNACTSPTIVTGAMPTGQDARYFDYACNPAPTATTYTITATAKSNLDIAGLAYSINETNTKTSTVTAGSTIALGGWVSNAGCWTTRKGGSC